jgi:hypothetical protein
MKAQEVPLLTLLAGPRQFVIPVFQRDYSWTEAQCQQLLEDVLRVAKAPDGVIHFMGSIVYVSDDNLDAVLPQWMVIDGQQRLTSCTLLLIALRERLAPLGDAVPLQDSARALDEQFLQNPYAPQPSLRAKLALRGLDDDWLAHALLSRQQPANVTSRVPENLSFFREALDDRDPREVLKGVRRLMVVSVSLKAGQDNPQLIFESLNSTGLSLTQADLVRNYVLMGHAEPRQTEWYETYWKPLEAAFGNRYRDLFDNFLRDFLSVEFRLVKPLKLDAVYREFRHWYPTHLNQPEHQSEGSARLQRLLRYGRHYCRYMIGPAGSPVLEAAMARLRELVDVAAPLVMALLEYFEHDRTLTEPGLIEALDVIESYVFRRSVIGAETRSGGTLFTTLAYKIDRANPLPSLKAQLARFGRGKEFPTDAPFLTALNTEDMYHRRTAFYMLARLTNSGREKVDLANLTIEHVLPQKEQLAPEWRTMLGEGWKEIQTTWLHRLGNLTLTAFNSEFQAKPFPDKKLREPGGYVHSPVWLNQSLAACEAWGPEQIKARGDMLARKALEIWKPLVADPRAIEQADLQEALELAAGLTVDAIPCPNNARSFFDSLVEFARGLNGEVKEVPRPKSVVYRAPAWFAELLPRVGSVLVRLALEPEEAADISDGVTPSSAWEFVVNSAVTGGSVFTVRTQAELETAKRLLKRAHQLALEGD